MSIEPVLVGVHPGQRPGVASEAARLATALSCPLVCAYADPAMAIVSERADGSVLAEPLDPDFLGRDLEFPPSLSSSLARELQSFHGPWRTVLLAGDPVRALTHCAETIRAQMIVLGTHANAHLPLGELLHVSVAARLTRHVDIPLVLVPARTHFTSMDRPTGGGTPR